MKDYKSILPQRAYGRIVLCVTIFFYLLICYNGLWNIALYPADAKYTDTFSSFLDICQMLTPATLIAASFGALSVLELVCTVEDNEWKTIMEMILWSLLTILMNAFTAYQISLGNNYGMGIWLILIITSVVNIIWYISTINLLKSSKRLHTLADKFEEKEAKKDDIKEQKCLDDRTTTGLVTSTLRKMGCDSKTEVKGKRMWVYFTYQGENFTIECNDENFYINIYDTWWHGISIYSDVEEIANLHRVVNLANQYAYCTLLYTTNKEIEEIGVHSKKNILFIKEIPELDKYLIGTLDDFFKVQRFVLTELEKCKVTENR